MSRGVVLVAVLAVGLAGCGGHARSAPAPAKPRVALVPFDSSVPPVLTRGPAQPASACRAAQLKVDATGLAFLPAAKQGGTGSFVLRNTSGRACRLTGRPTVRFVGGTAPPPQTQRSLSADAPAFPQLVPPDSTLLALAPGQGAVLSLDWDNWCPRTSAAAKQKPLQPPKALRVTLPRQTGDLDVRYNAVVACEHAGRPSVIGVRPFAPEPLKSTSAFTNVPMRATAHPLDGGSGPLRGRRGQVLRFAIELRNASNSGTVRFDRCPLVAEKFAPVGATEAHPLACSHAAPIAPGKAQWFEMQVRVPANAPLGVNGLFWRLDPVSEFAPQTVARVIVAR